VTLIAGGAAVKFSAPISVNPPLALEPASAPWASVPQNMGEVGTPRFERGWVSPKAQLAHVHCSMVSALPSGDLLALWYGGSREGAADVAVFTSRMTAGTKTWGPPVKVLDRASVEGAGTPAPPDLLRLSTGLEDVGDLIADLEQALAAAHR
jgi:hypothetical protein